MTKTLIDKMVDQFLGWKLPKDFCPDAGISFNPTKPYEGDELGNSWWPVGTNLMTAEQARVMITHMLTGAIPSDQVPSEENGEYYIDGYFDGHFDGHGDAIAEAVGRINATIIVDGETNERLRCAIAGRVADLGKQT